MSERNLDFDTPVERKGTDCLKYDFAVERGMSPDILPLWVADMDFRISSYIQDALAAQAAHGIYGYSDSKEDYFAAVRDWMKRKHGWQVEEKWLVKTPGVVFALAMAVRAFTKEGEAVMIQQPVYYPFSSVIKDNGRKLVSNTLVQKEDGHYEMDLADFERKVKEEKVKLFFLCNPHNPVGRVWDRESLLEIGRICVENHVVVVSDEIHADFIFEGTHQVFADLSDKIRDISVTCTAPSKTFNIAGLQVSNIFIANDSLRRRFVKEISAAGYSQVNASGLVACRTAYAQGEEWYQGMMAYVRANIDFAEQYIREQIPEIRMRKPEGTYLLWLDFRRLSLTSEELEDLIVRKAGLWLDSGAIFGACGEGFQRINAACTRATLTEALGRIKNAIKNS